MTLRICAAFAVFALACGVLAVDRLTPVDESYAEALLAAQKGVFASGPSLPLPTQASLDLDSLTRASTCLARAERGQVRLRLTHRGCFGGSTESVELLRQGASASLQSSAYEGFATHRVIDRAPLEVQETEALFEDLTSALARPYVPSRCISTAHIEVALEFECDDLKRSASYSTSECDDANGVRADPHGPPGEGYHPAFGLAHWAQRVFAAHPGVVLRDSSLSTHR